MSEYALFLQKMTARGYKMICWGPVASQKDVWHGNKDFPAVGTEGINCNQTFTRAV